MEPLPPKALFCPTEVLLDSRIQRDLLCWDGIQIILLVEFAHGICCLDVAIRGDGRTISYITYMCALVNSGMSLGVDLVELMPADEIPVTIPVVKHKLATACAADLPNQVAYAMVVGGIGSRSQGDLSVVVTEGTLLDEVHTLVEVVLSDSAQFCFCLSIVEQYYRVPVDRSIGVTGVGVCTIVRLQGLVIKLEDGLPF